jgi:hypothetical protein
MMKRALLLLALIVAPPLWAADELADFTTDGCSLFPDGSPVERNLWCDCCVAHDVAYWRGGTEAQRKEADEALRACVEQRTNKPFAELVYAGVRAGGMPVFPTWYRWGYGWKYGRGYTPLSEAEAVAVETRLQEYLARHAVPSCDSEGVTESAADGTAAKDTVAPPGL